MNTHRMQIFAVHFNKDDIFDVHYVRAWDKKDAAVTCLRWLAGDSQHLQSLWSITSVRGAFEKVAK